MDIANYSTFGHTFRCAFDNGKLLIAVRRDSDGQKVAQYKLISPTEGPVLTWTENPVDRLTERVIMDECATLAARYRRGDLRR